MIELGQSKTGLIRMKMMELLSMLNTLPNQLIQNLSFQHMLNLNYLVHRCK